MYRRQVFGLYELSSLGLSPYGLRIPIAGVSPSVRHHQRAAPSFSSISCAS